MDNRWLLAVDSLEALAGLAAEPQCPLEATRLFGAVLTLRNPSGMAR